MEELWLACQRCGYYWPYRGKKLKWLGKLPLYTSCPNCKGSVKLTLPQVLIPEIPRHRMIIERMEQKQRLKPEESILQ